MDSDSAKASVESIQDDPECMHASNDSNRACGDSSVPTVEGDGGCEGIDALEHVAPLGEGEGAVLNSVDVVEAVSAEPSPAVVTEGGGEESSTFVAQEMDLVGGGSSAVEVVPLESSPVIGEGGGEERAADFPLVSEKVSNLEGNRERSMEAEPPTLDLPASEVNGDDSLRDESQQVVSGGMTDEKSSQAIDSKLESEKEKVDVMEEDTTGQAASLEDIVSVDIDIPDVKDVATVAGFTDISSQDKGLGDSVPNSGSEFLEDEPLKELQSGEGAKDLTDGDAKEDVNVTEGAMGNQLVKKAEEDEKPDDITVSENKTKPQDMDYVANEGSHKNETRVGESSASKETVMDDVKEDVEKDPEAGKSMDMHVPEAAEELETNVNFGDEIEKDGEGMAGVGEAEQTVDLEETRKLSEELAKVEETKIAEASEKIETVIRHEDEEKMDDMTDVAEDVKIHVDSSVADIEGRREDLEEMGVTEALEETVSKVEGTKIAEVSEETETRIEDEDQGKDDDMTDVKTHGDSLVTDIEERKESQEEVGISEMTETQEETVEGKADGTKVVEVSEDAGTKSEDVDQEKDENMIDVKILGDSSVADIDEEKERQEEMGMTEMTETQEETVEGKADGTKAAEMSEETEARTEDEDEEKDENMTDAETHEVDEGKESQEEMEMTELTVTQEENVMAETGDEDAEDADEENKGVGGKRKRVRNTKTGKKKEEDVCFVCFDGGDLVLCDRRGCPKAYHPSCVNQDEDFFRSKGKWNCGWHQCSKCEKNATYLCYTCVFSLCKGCAKDAVFSCIRGNKGLCETCMETIKMIEREEQEKKEPAQLDFDDKTNWESLFKDYWIDLKTQLSISPEELDQAKSPQKGNKSHAGKQGTARETDYVTDEGSDSDSSPKKRKTRSRSKSGSAEKIQSPAKKSSSGETMEWASKELLDVVAHMRRGDKSFLTSTEVHDLLLDYIKRYNLRDPRRKSQVVCDSRLKNLFGKSHVGHFEMLNLLDTHFLVKEQQQADNMQGSIVDTDPDYVDLDENLDHPVKSGKDKKRKTRKKGGRKGRQSNLDDFAAVDMHNINLIYLRRSLVEDLLEDSTGFEEKVASAFVRLRISGNQKQDLYRLVQVVGTSKAPEPYKVGKKTTDYVLEILNLDKTEVISIDIISNQDFTEDECKRLRQSIKCGLINRLTVGDIQEKAIALQEVRVKNLLDAEILRYGHLRDRASDMGHRKELRECVEKVQLLKSPEERQRRLEEIPEIHADPKMDPDCESEDEDEKEEKEKEKNLRRRSSSFNRRGRDPISPRKGGFSSNESWTGTSNFTNTSASRELSRSYSGRGSTGRGDYLGSSDDKVSDNLWSSGREREKDVQQYLGSEKPRSVSLPEPPPRSSRAVAPPELSPRLAPEISTAPPPVVPPPAPKSNDSEKIWHYKDPSGKVQGPFSMAQLRKWNNTGYFPAKLEIWKANESSLDSVLLTDALAGLFQKQAPLVDNSYTKAYSGQSSHSEPNLGFSARTAPTVLDIPKNSQDTWSSGGSLPSPTPTQVTTPMSKRRNFESRWSPTKPSAQSAVQSMSFPSAQSVTNQAPRTDIPMVVNSAGALQPGTHPLPTPDPANVSINHYGGSAPLPSPTPVGGMQSWGNLQTDKFDSHGRGGHAPPSQNISASYGTATPSVLPSQSQPGFPSSDSWRVPVQSQSNTQAQAPAWGMNNSQNSGQTQAPANQNNSWGQGTVNPNMGWAGPPQAGMNVNWAATSVPPTGQGVPNPGWSGPVQGQTQAYPNAGWGVTGQAQSQAQVQAPGSSTSSGGWMQPGQGMQPGNSNQNWGTQNQTAMPSGGSGGNQTGYWGNQQNRNGESGYGWNRQSSGSGGHNSFKGQRVCKFHRENGHCRKGAACNYLHN
ncbi:unnamed protein product [Eruca vesicaria subsp. sativa]|uniref:Uncharacterized protein n=1 Tax=Eruca vesicaria subsp. sativa TaxID=29727 RepID=A0ABC8KSS7_ERUVS|nr:unnamed protein product [Eruca vesicaria subsp. sativa]